MSRVLMTLEDALMIKKIIVKAKTDSRTKTALPSGLALLAGATEGFCKVTGNTQMTRQDLETYEKKVRTQWQEKGADARDPLWGKMISIQKILENWVETEEIESEDEGTAE